MFDNDSAATTDALMAGIDVAIEAQLSWDQQLLRCSLLRESARDGMLRPNAHLLCQFGIWLSACHARLQQYDEPAVGRLFATHMAMHQAVSSMCENALAGSAAREQDLEAFRHQVSMRQRDPSARAATPRFEQLQVPQNLGDTL